ncbi:MAG TPA: hypothetical protein VII94_03485 [Candidatus Saccharimonadales bacterium]
MRPGTEENYLLDKDGKMCCLGFAGRYLCNLPDERLLDSGTPAHLGDAFWQGLPWLLQEAENIHGEPIGTLEDSYECKELMYVNDDSMCSDAEREVIIIETFAEYGIDVTFEG